MVSSTDLLAALHDLTFQMAAETKVHPVGVDNEADRVFMARLEDGVSKAERLLDLLHRQIIEDRKVLHKAQFEVPA